MNRFERNLGFKGEAKLKYLDGEVQVLSPGDFVRCAVTGRTIPLDELRYWSVELQEAYIDAATSLKRFRETHPYAREIVTTWSSAFASSAFTAASSSNSTAMGKGRRAEFELAERRALLVGDPHEVLLGRDQHGLALLGLFQERRRLAARVAVMIAEGVLGDDARAVSAERRVEFFRRRDSSEGNDGEHAEPAFVLARNHARLQHWLATCREGLLERRRVAAGADDDQSIGAGDLGIERRAQGARRHHQPIADAKPCIDHDQRQVLGETRILEAVIHDDGGRIGVLDRLGARRTVCRDHGRRDLREQQRLVSHLRRAIALA